MKIGLPLPNEKKQVFVSKEVMKTLPVPFQNANVLNVSFTQSDIDYLENTIKTHKLYHVVRENHIYAISKMGKTDNLRSMIALAQFYKQFINDKKCPKNLKRFLDIYVALLNQNVQQFYSQKATTEMNFIMDSWARTCH